jgi:hypothetical protein
MADSNDQTKPAASKQLHAAIDRIEDGGMAVLLLGDDEMTQIDLPLAMLPQGAVDGDHLTITISIDKESRDAAASRVKELQDKLARKTNGAQDQKDFKL